MMQRISMVIPTKLWERAKQAAIKAAAKEKQPVSASEIVRRALETYLDKEHANERGR